MEVEMAVRYDDVAVVEWLRRVAGAAWDDEEVEESDLDICAVAAATSLRMLQCVRRLGCPWGEFYGDWKDLTDEVKEWLCGEGRCPWEAARVR